MSTLVFISNWAQKQQEKNSQTGPCVHNIEGFVYSRDLGITLSFDKWLQMWQDEYGGPQGAEHNNPRILWNHKIGILFLFFGRFVNMFC